MPPLPATVQSVIVRRDRAGTAERAARIAKKYRARISKVDETNGFFRFRQHPPENYFKRSFRTFYVPGSKGTVAYIYATPKGLGDLVSLFAKNKRRWSR